jgi:hypothetical protein
MKTIFHYDAGSRLTTCFAALAAEGFEVTSCPEAISDPGLCYRRGGIGFHVPNSRAFLASRGYNCSLPAFCIPNHIHCGIPAGCGACGT